MKLFIAQGSKSALLITIGDGEIPEDTPIDDILAFLGNKPPRTIYDANPAITFLYYENFEYRIARSENLLVDDEGAPLLEGVLINHRASLPPDHHGVRGLFLIDGSQHLILDDASRFLIQPI